MSKYDSIGYKYVKALPLHDICHAILLIDFTSPRPIRRLGSRGVYRPGGSGSTSAARIASILCGASAARLIIDDSASVVELKVTAGQQLLLDLRPRALDARFRARERDPQPLTQRFLG